MAETWLDAYRPDHPALEACTHPDCTPSFPHSKLCFNCGEPHHVLNDLYCLECGELVRNPAVKALRGAPCAGCGSTDYVGQGWRSWCGDCLPSKTVDDLIDTRGDDARSMGSGRSFG